MPTETKTKYYGKSCLSYSNCIDRVLGLGCIAALQNQKNGRLINNW